MEVHDTLKDAPAAKKTKAFGTMVTLDYMHICMQPKPLLVTLSIIRFIWEKV